MPSWALDKNRFVEEVFLPVATGWDAERDRFRCYQLPLDVADPALIQQALEGVSRHLNQNALGGVHAGAARVLRGAHDKAREVLLDPPRRDAHRREVLAARDVLRGAVRAEAKGAATVPPAAVSAVTARFAGRFVPREVDTAFAELGVRVRVPTELAVPPTPPTWADIRLALSTLGLRSLGAYLRSPERRLGATPTDTAVTNRRRAINTSARGDELTAEEKILAALERWKARDGLVDVLRRDAVDALTSEAAMGPDHLAAALRPAPVQRYLAELGLPDPDELGYALLCRIRYPSAAASGWKATVEAALSARDLRTARDVLAAQQNLPPDLSRRRDALAAQLGEIDRQLVRARGLEGQDAEAAAELYSTVLRTCGDPDAESGLRRCRPAPPPRAQARVDGYRVQLEWDASPARVGDITYRIVRRAPDSATGDGVVVASDTSALSVIDADAPSGSPVSYAVTTLRDGEPSARVATTASVEVLRPVSDLELVPGDGLVEVRWTLPDGADGARVRRAEDGAADTVTTTEHDGSGFRDTGLRTGVAYLYRVEARYRLGRPDPVHAASVTGRVRPQAPPQPVVDLRVEPGEDDVVLRWTPPPRGDVRILLLAAAPREPSGRALARSAADRLGSPARGRGPAVEDGLRIDPPAGGRRHWLLPVTVVDDLAVIGTATAYDSRLPAVTDLTVTQLGRRVRLTWTWPPSAAEVRVYRKDRAPATGPDDRDATSERLTHAAYQREGCHLPARPGEQWYGVCVVTVDGGVEVSGPIEHRRLATLREVRYEIERVRGLGKGRLRRLALAADAGSLPAVQVRGRVGLPPLSPDDGERLARFDAPEAGLTTLHEEFDVTLRGRPLHLRAFPIDDPATVLVPVHPAQLRID